MKKSILKPVSYHADRLFFAVIYFRFLVPMNIITAPKNPTARAIQRVVLTGRLS